MTRDASVRVTVVVPTYNRSELLARALRALERVEPPPGGFEVVVVDDGSESEHAAAVARAVGASPNARLVSRPNGGPSAARNAGIAAARGELVAFLDDDCAPAPDWLAKLAARFEGGDTRLAAVGGCVLPEVGETWAQRFCSAVEYGTGTQPVFENASTQNACYRRSVLEEVGGFDEGFRHPGGDDPDLSFRAVAAGYRLEYAPDAVVHHAELPTYRDFVRHMYYRGLGEARIGKKFGRRGRVVARLALWPAFLARTALASWRRTRGKAGRLQRGAWVALEVPGRLAFLAGSCRALLRRP